jgi:hypothetical protein
MSQQYIIDESGDRKYYVVTPQLVWALSRDPYDYTLWGVVKMIAGEEGECWVNTDNLASLAMMSAGKVSQCRRYLIEVGLLRGTRKKSEGSGQWVWHLRIPDLWQQNLEWRQEMGSNLQARIAYKNSLKSFHPVKPSSGEAKLSSDEVKPSPNEIKFPSNDAEPSSAEDKLSPAEGKFSSDEAKPSPAEGKLSPNEDKLSPAEARPSSDETKNNHEEKPLLQPAENNDDISILINHYRQISKQRSPRRRDKRDEWLADLKAIHALTDGKLERTKQLMSEAIDTLRLLGYGYNGPGSLYNTCLRLGEAGQDASEKDDKGPPEYGVWVRDQIQAGLIDPYDKPTRQEYYQQQLWTIITDGN